MMKKITTSLMALIFAAGVTTTAFAARSVTCTIETIDDGKILLDCGDKAEKFETGIKVKIKKVVKRKAVEGC